MAERQAASKDDEDLHDDGNENEAKARRLEAEAQAEGGRGRGRGRVGADSGTAGPGGPKRRVANTRRPGGPGPGGGKR